jgi:Uma2 family endonuclease
MAPIGFQPTRTRSLQPDLLVVAREDVGELGIERALLLAVEVLSPSTRSKDLLLKRGLYEQSGVSSYWIVDPDDASVLVLELQGGEFAEVAHVVGGDVLSLGRPYPISFSPAELLL